MCRASCTISCGLCTGSWFLDRKYRDGSFNELADRVRVLEEVGEAIGRQ